MKTLCILASQRRGVVKYLIVILKTKFMQDVFKRKRVTTSTKPFQRGERHVTDVTNNDNNDSLLNEVKRNNDILLSLVGRMKKTEKRLKDY